MDTRLSRVFLPLVAIAGLSICVGAQAQPRDDTQWSITPYLWGTKTKVDLSLRDTNLGSGVITFPDLLDVLDGAFMVHAETGAGRWSAFVDLTYLSTSDTRERPLLTIDTDSEQTFLDAVAVFWPGGTGSPLSLFGGLRYSGFDDRYRFSAGGDVLATQRSSDDYYDALLGLRYRFDLSDRWALLTRGDLSFGDSEGTFLVQANFAYTVGSRRQNRVLFGYQYKQAEFKSGEVKTDFTYSGPMAGFNFRF